MVWKITETRGLAEIFEAIPARKMIQLAKRSRFDLVLLVCEVSGHA
jgi:hypothetical protein